MSTINFNCIRCGKCCRNLIDDFNGLKGGLLLTAQEIQLFPSEMISPKYALGFSKPKRVLIYQLNVNDCPHFSEDKGCLIYEKRPLKCKAFPYDGAWSLKCTILGNQMREGECRSVDAPIELSEAHDKFSRYKENRFRKFSKRGKRKWIFDLETKTWKIDNNCR